MGSVSASDARTPDSGGGPTPVPRRAAGRALLATAAVLALVAAPALRAEAGTPPTDPPPTEPSTTAPPQTTTPTSAPTTTSPPTTEPETTTTAAPTTTASSGGSSGGGSSRSGSGSSRRATTTAAPEEEPPGEEPPPEEAPEEETTTTEAETTTTTEAETTTTTEAPAPASVVEQDDGPSSRQGLLLAGGVGLGLVGATVGWLMWRSRRSPFDGLSGTSALVFPNGDGASPRRFDDTPAPTTVPRLRADEADEVAAIAALLEPDQGELPPIR